MLYKYTSNQPPYSCSPPYTSVQIYPVYLISIHHTSYQCVLHLFTDRHLNLYQCSLWPLHLTGAIYIPVVICSPTQIKHMNIHRHLSIIYLEHSAFNSLTISIPLPTTYFHQCVTQPLHLTCAFFTYSFNNLNSAPDPSPHHQCSSQSWHLTSVFYTSLPTASSFLSLILPPTFINASFSLCILNVHFISNPPVILILLPTNLLYQIPTSFSSYITCVSCQYLAIHR